MSTTNTTAIPSPTFQVLDTTPIMAPVLIGHSFNWFGFGALVVQIYVYYASFPNDSLSIRCLVYGLLFLEVVQTVMTTHETYWYLVTNWNDPAALATFPWSAMTVPLLSGLVAFVVQAFYAWRVWTLARSAFMKTMAVSITALAAASSMVAIVTASDFAAHASHELLLKLRPAFSAWLGLGLGADILVAVCMSWILYNAKSNTVWQDSETMITRLITNTIGTGIAVAVCGLITLVLFVTSPEASQQFLSAAYLLGKLYSNSVLVSLNARKIGRSRETSRRETTASGGSYPMQVRVAREVFSTPDTNANAITPSQVSKIPSFGDDSESHAPTEEKVESV